MFIWNDEMIRFMEDAAGYGDYHKRLAKMVHGYIPEAERICDAGCGLGFLSLELSQYYSDITAVDLSPKAISVLEKNIEERGIGNIRPFSGDIHQMIPQKPYDSMVFCFFGQLEEILKIARQQCKDSVIIVKRRAKQHAFAMGKIPGHWETSDFAAEYLKHHQIPYEEEVCGLEYGQPFKSLEDAVRFFELYQREKIQGPITGETVAEKLVKDPKGRFAYYLPFMKPFTIMKIHVKDLKI